MRTFCLIGGLLLVGAMAACSGGTEPVVGEPGPGPREPGDGDRPTDGDNPFNIGTGPQGPTGPGPGSTGSGSCVTCNQVLNGEMGSTDYCPDSVDALGAIGTCVADFCTTECSALDSTCLGCLQTACPTAVSDCMAN
jgi:hypothetical protein